MDEKVPTKDKSDISEIFENEGIPGDYPLYVAPVDVARDSDFCDRNQIETSIGEL